MPPAGKESQQDFAYRDPHSLPPRNNHADELDAPTPDFPATGDLFSLFGLPTIFRIGGAKCAVHHHGR